MSWDKDFSFLMLHLHVHNRPKNFLSEFSGRDETGRSLVEVDDPMRGKWTVQTFDSILNRLLSRWLYLIAQKWIGLIP